MLSNGPPFRSSVQSDPTRPCRSGGPNGQCWSARCGDRAPYRHFRSMDFGMDETPTPHADPTGAEHAESRSARPRGPRSAAHERDEGLSGRHITGGDRPAVSRHTGHGPALGAPLQNRRDSGAPACSPDGTTPRATRHQVTALRCPFCGEDRLVEVIGRVLFCVVCAHQTVVHTAPRPREVGAGRAIGAPGKATPEEAS